MASCARRSRAASNLSCWIASTVAFRTACEASFNSRVIPGPSYPPGTPTTAIPTTTPTNQAAMDAARLDRVYLSVFMSMASPDYLVQK